MDCQAIRPWTLSKLIGAFLDLSIAYVLLCCSTVAFFISEFLGFLGFSLPNHDHCLQKLLVDCPTNKISDVQLSVRTRFPFDSVWERNEDCQLSFKVVSEKKLEGGVIELEDEASSSSVWKNEALAATEEGKFDVKGKAVVRNRRQRGNNVRRRRRSSTDQMKLTPGYGNSNTGKESSDNSTAVDSHDMVPLESQRIDEGQHLENDGHLENKIRILEQALKEEQAARAALFFDLEKERTAAATAADEAMAMILRLQEEKAAIELEARQYERILEEKSTYDAEEMDILKEIIVRREMENHYLEKEVESYMNMLQEKEKLDEDVCNVVDIRGETLLIPIENALPLGESSTSHDHGYQEKSIVLIGEVKDDGETDSNEQYDGKDPVLLDGNLDVKEQHLYDIHVIDEDKAESSMTNDDSSNAVRKFELPPLSNSTCESKASELHRNSSAAVDHERQKLDNEVGWLRERLRSIQDGRAKLNVSLEHKDKGETELLLLDDIANLLQEIKKLTEPQKNMRRTSLPPPGSKDASKKRRCRSASVEPYRSS